MRLVVLTALFLAIEAGSSSAQIPGMPLWNDPNAGTGITISGEAGFPDESSFGTTFAARGNVSFGALQVGATVGMRDPDPGDRLTSAGATVAFRVIGGTVLPVALNAQAGYATELTDPVNVTRFTTALGVGVKAPVPGLDLRAWLSPGVRFLRHPDASGGRVTDSNFGVAGGASLGFGIWGVHAGIDHENNGGAAPETLIGIGVHIGLHAPVPM